MSVPAMPRVISPSPTPSEDQESSDGYFGPTTRSGTRRRIASPPPIDEEIDDVDSSDSSFELKRARTRSRSPVAGSKARRRLSALTAAKPPAASSTSTSTSRPPSAAVASQSTATGLAAPNGTTSNGHLSPTSAGSSYWRDFSRSPSPLGLIPIHRHWRSIVHRHEVPRKVLHVSIGFVTLYLYTSGVRIRTIPPYLLALFIPIFSVDWLRHRFAALNRFYIRVCGALMRESEVAGWNGVIWYLVGAWLVLRLLPKDVAVVSVLLLSWCDTAASTFGRAYGRYTPRLRRGKTLAGSAAAFVVGAGTAALFWGWLAPRIGPVPHDPQGAFMYAGRLSLERLGGRAEVRGGLALMLVSLWTGFVGAASEVVDLFGWDDNLTIPVLSGLGLWGFLKAFG
ncbi:MAG: hypothetical protein M1825_004192 [Sarcosagium campestre]|nr:MAG: hypothetical protein M1825_004192 [Sarcosagium campestre]